MVIDSVLLPLLIFFAAVLFSSVGHAGASGYLAAMALCGVAPDVMKPGALILNILVASITSVRFWRAGQFSWYILAPFIMGSVPCAFVGGYITLPGAVYRPIVAIALYAAGARLILKPEIAQDQPKPIMARLAVLLGSGIGFVSGLTGIGGGVFLSPLLMFMRWTTVKQTAAVSAVFILVNSISGLLGLLTKGAPVPTALPIWAIAAVAGGFLGSGLGSRRLGNVVLVRLLALVLFIAGTKLLLM